MRKQARPPAPPAFREHAETWNRQWTELRARNASASFGWYKLDGLSARDHALPALRLMNQGHCSFCDTFPMEDRSAEPIEHFKPKSDPRFHGEAYSWDNLFYCCDHCQRSKGEQWDDRLLRPDAADYAFDRFFMFDYTTGEMKPNYRATDLDKNHAAITIRIFDLDSDARRRMRRLELRKWRATECTDSDEYAYRDFLAC